MAKLPRVTRKNRCRICGRADYCGFTPDGNLAICMRVATSSIKQAANGGWIHALRDEGRGMRDESKQSLSCETPEILRAGSELKHKVYSAFLDLLVLALPHHSDLRARGLSDVSIFAHGYKSMPTAKFSDNICRALAAQFNLKGVPGFYFQADAWHFVDYFRASGYLIPIRNDNLEICALQLRRDDDRKPKYLMISSSDKPRGASSGAPPHFAALGLVKKREEVKEIIITEGALKANIILELARLPVVGLVGTGSFDASLPELIRQKYPCLEFAQIAFDMDAATNEAVRWQRKRLEKTFRDAGITPIILAWNPEYKGLDDCLLSIAQDTPATKNFLVAA